MSLTPFQSPSRSAGRHNKAGQTALYLGADPSGLRVEMIRFAEIGSRLYYVRYDPINSLAVVDLSDASIAPALHLAFDRAERLDTPYEASQELADVVRALKIDGMIVSGVRGNLEHQYCNVVLFNCSGWENWVDVTHLPKYLQCHCQ